MKITIESTTKIVEVNGVPARVWEGKTDTGIELHCFVTRIAVNKTDDASQFEKELLECRPPRNPDIQAYDFRLFLPDFDE
jgi:hypothetical protein